MNNKDPREDEAIWVGKIKAILNEKDINAPKGEYAGIESGLSEYEHQLERVVNAIRDNDTLHGIAILHRLIK